MHILVLNSAVPIQRVAGEEWANLNVSVHPYNILWGRTPTDMFDFDVFVAGPEPFPSEQLPSDGKQISSQIGERVAAGGCLIVFPGSQPVAWLPQQMGLRPGQGQRITVEAGDGALESFFRKHQERITYRTQLERGVEGWTPLVLALNGFPVAATNRHGRGLVILMPELPDHGRVVRELLDVVIPAVLPELQRDRAPTPQGEPPDWISQFPVSEADALGTQVEALQATISQLRQQIEGIDARRRELLEFQGLLWLEGKPLERAAEAALNLLGIEAHPKGLVDLACPTPDGGQLYIEIEGTTGPIQIRKGRQLLGYIAEENDPGLIRGAILGNPYRDLHPSNRPPPGSTGGLFSPPLERLATSQTLANDHYIAAV